MKNRKNNQPNIFNVPDPAAAIVALEEKAMSTLSGPERQELFAWMAIQAAESGNLNTVNILRWPGWEVSTKGERDA